MVTAATHTNFCIRNDNWSTFLHCGETKKLDSTRFASPLIRTEKYLILLLPQLCSIIFWSRTLLNKTMKKQFFSPIFILLLLLLLIHEHGKHGQILAQDDYIKIAGGQFILGGSSFYINGFNAYWFMIFGSDPSRKDKVSTAFKEAIDHGLTVARIWAFSDGGGTEALQYSPGSYNENIFQGLDFVISEAKKYGVRLILSLVNNHNDFGGKKQYVEWGRSKGQSLASDDDFFRNEVVKGLYKNHIKAVLTRKNTISGVIYKDDPTIMAWELMNEPRTPTDLSGKTIQDWISEMASYLKSIDSKHLLEVGLEGFYGSDPKKRSINPNSQLIGTDFIANNQVADIDFATVHSYPDAWLSGQSDAAQLTFLKNWVNAHIQDAQNILRKPVLFAEFGKSTKDPGFSVSQRDAVFDVVYSAVFSSAVSGGAAAGGLYWQFLTEGMDSNRDGYEVIFSEGDSTANLITQQSQKLSKTRKLYYKV
ncbi:OLC1v1018023C1 [Oldenlandia corymbosa var. corymbosa]|uniref:mannan endo-1,4-beta-mannosidase n=1 Tax=Oldenlandia corymbosa var. corymbosa TaxID=529605 RepID=A0AAV1EAR7_OLDCO|nr:OLC1v1018023C1 [Oldenlandia corymbosa var. corymbosa]